jgi:hypothetical protein
MNTLPEAEEEEESTSRGGRLISDVESSPLVKRPVVECASHGGVGVGEGKVHGPVGEGKGNGTADGEGGVGGGAGGISEGEGDD